MVLVDLLDDLSPRCSIFSVQELLPLPCFGVWESHDVLEVMALIVAEHLESSVQ